MVTKLGMNPESLIPDRRVAPQSQEESSRGPFHNVLHSDENPTGCLAVTVPDLHSG